MKQKIAMMWIEALESGAYEQTTGALRETNSDGGTGFCCLGVLCNLHAQTHPKIAAMQDHPAEYLGSDDFAPKEVMKWSGLKTNNAKFMEFNPSKEYDADDNCVKSLVDLNDEDNYDFKQIAAVIRKNWRKL